MADQDTAKILLVEDDNNLREIYETRLSAEGYTIVTAKDGEEALSVAVKEKPDLIISDVMMPKISGFDMLDIIRSTDETKHAKVVMMTALSQAEDKERASKLGADRYLVKSQVTLEDMARVAREVLNGENPPEEAASEKQTQPTPESEQQPVASVNNKQTVSEPQPVNNPVADNQAEADQPQPQVQATDTSPVTPPPAAQPQPEPVQQPQTNADVQSSQPTPSPTNTPVESPDQVQAKAVVDSVNENNQTAEQELSDIQKQLEEFENKESNLAASTHPETENESSESQQEQSTDAAAANKKVVIQPISDINSKPDLDALVAKEAEKEAMANVAQGMLNNQQPQPQAQPSVQPVTQPGAVQSQPSNPQPQAAQPNQNTQQPPVNPPKKPDIDPNSIAL
jgi:DNA-binding response OmpR family regulator